MIAVNKHLCTQLTPTRPGFGFTLVELLVALALVALMMSLFAQVFQIATGTMSTQRGVMENDQRARSIETVIRNDLRNRSMRSVMPFLPGESSSDYVGSPPGGYYLFSKREGFVSISENEPSNDADDVLHCTVRVSSGDEPFYGRALPLTNLIADPNQPDADDGVVASISTWAGSTAYQVGTYVASTSTVYPILDKRVFLCVTAGTSGLTEPGWPTNLGGTVNDGSVTWVATTYSNRTATSRMAEVVYFVRNGNLYRRVLLIRQPLDSTYDRQPRDGSNNDMFLPANGYYVYPTLPDPPYGADFWKDFDFSAGFQSKIDGARFTGGGAVGIDPLDNSAATYLPIAIPFNRFGHNPVTTSSNDCNGTVGSLTASYGNPREYVGNLFIGRFTQEETSHAFFNFPHSLSAQNDKFNTTNDPGQPLSPINDGYPMRDDQFNTTIPVVNPLTDNTTNGVIGSPPNGVVDQYEQGDASLRPRRGEDILLAHVHSFDVKVWDDIIGDYVDIGHDMTDAGGNPIGDFNQTTRNLRPTYGPKAVNSGAVNRMFDTWHPAFDANNDSMVDTNDLPPFAPRYEYRANGDTTAVSNQWTPSTPYKLGSVVIPRTSNGFAYQATAILTPGSVTGTSDTAEPTWPVVPPSSYGATVDDNDIRWTLIPNVKRLKSLKITIRYLDVTSDQMRQVTLIHALLD